MVCPAAPPGCPAAPPGCAARLPGRPAARLPGRPAARPPGRPAARPPGRPAAPPGVDRPAARLPGCPAARLPGCPAARLPGCPAARLPVSPPGCAVRLRRPSARLPVRRVPGAYARVAAYDGAQGARARSATLAAPNPLACAVGHHARPDGHPAGRLAAIRGRREAPRAGPARPRYSYSRAHTKFFLLKKPAYR